MSPQPIKQAMILAAGLGTRMRPLTLKTPKCLVPIHGVPLLARTLMLLESQGVERAIVNTHYLAPQVQDFVNAFPTAMQIDISDEPELLDSGGGVLKALPFFQGHPFYLINADAYWGDTGHEALKKLNSQWHEEDLARLLLVPTQSHPSSPGDYFYDQDTHHLTHRGDQAVAPYVYASLGIMHPQLFEGYPVAPCHLVKTFFHQAQSQGRLKGTPYEGFWCGIDDMETLNALHQKTA